MMCDSSPCRRNLRHSSSTTSCSLVILISLFLFLLNFRCSCSLVILIHHHHHHHHYLSVLLPTSCYATRAACGNACAIGAGWRYPHFGGVESTVSWAFRLRCSLFAAQFAAPISSVSFAALACCFVRRAGLLFRVPPHIECPFALFGPCCLFWCRSRLFGSRVRASGLCASPLAADRLALYYTLITRPDGSLIDPS